MHPLSLDIRVLCIQKTFTSDINAIHYLWHKIKPLSTMSENIIVQILHRYNM